MSVYDTFLKERRGIQEEAKAEPKKKGVFKGAWDWLRGTVDTKHAIKVGKEKAALSRERLEEKLAQEKLDKREEPKSIYDRFLRETGKEEKEQIDPTFLTARLGIPQPTLAGTTPMMAEKRPEIREPDLLRETLQHLTLNDFKEATITVAKKAPELPKMFIPAITEFSKTTMGILGEGIAYATDKTVREEYERGNMDILPLISSKTTTDIAKLTIAAGIETAVYKLIPNYAKTKLAWGTRGSIGALQGLGFGVAEGMANDYTAEEIMKNLPYYMTFGAGMEVIAPYIQVMLSTQIKNLTPEARASFKSIWKEVRGGGMPDLSRPLRDQLLPHKILVQQGKEVMGDIPVRVAEKPKVAQVVEPPKTDPLQKSITQAKADIPIHLHKPVVEVMTEAYKTKNPAIMDRPIAFVKDGDKLSILEGEHRFYAAKQAGVEPPMVILTRKATDDLNAPQIDALARKTFKENTKEVIDFYNQSLKTEAPKITQAKADPLIQEARKYKSAEEFVKAQGTPVYHGTNYANARQIQQTGLNPESATSIKGDKKFVFLTGDEQYAKSYATQKGGDNSFVLSVKKPADTIIEESTYKKGMKFPDLVSQKAIPPEDIIIKGKDGKWYPIKEFNFFTGEVDTYIGKTPVDVKTKSQLTDIWNKAQVKATEIKPVVIKPKTEVKPVKQTEQAFSKHYERIKDQLGETEGITFDRINIKEEARKAFDYISNPLPNVKQKALRVAYGLEPAPQGLNAQAIRLSMVESLKEAGKLQQARALAREASLQFTKSAQDLNIAKLDLSTAGARKIESVLMADQLEKVGKRLPDVIEGSTKLAPKEKALRAIKKGAKEATDEIFKTAKIKSADDLLRAITC